MIVVLSAYACASTYYVSSSAGNDSYTAAQAQNPATPWRTLGKVNATTYVAGDRILLARGDVWREPLIPPSSGTSGDTIAFDTYGSGAAPEITGYQPLSGWTQVAGYTNQWKAPVTASAINYVLFATIWGTKQASQAALLHDRDFYFSGNTLYVFASSDPTTYYGSVAAMVVTNATPLISVNAKSWLTFQHLKLDWFDQYGVSVTGTSDHLVFANMEADGMIPAGILPLGFYVNASNPSDINFYNDSAHLNYDGFRVDGTAATINLTNCSAYANRDTGLTDNTGGHVTYSYSHFYANGTGGIESLDVVGATAGTGNLPADTAPGVRSFERYPARFSFTVDDVGLYAGSDTFVDALLPVFNARGLKMNAAIVTGPTGVSYSTTDVANWAAWGHEVDSHSWSHQYFTDPVYLASNHIFNSTNPTPATAFSLRYVGAGTAATVTVSGGILSTAVTGGPGGQNLNLNLATSPYDTLGGLTSYISSTYPGVYSVTTWTAPLMRVAAHSSTLASVSAQDIKTAAYGLQFDATRAVTGLMADEATQSRSWLQSHIAGLSNVKVYVYPDGVTDPAFEAAVAAAGYEGARGTLSMCVSGAAPCAGTNGFVSYATGVNAQNITSLSPVTWTNYASLTQKQLDAKVAALIFKMRVWGYPVGLFVHASDYPDAGTAAMKTGWLLDSIAAHGGSVSRTDELIEAVRGLQAISGTTKFVTAAEEELDLNPTTGAPGIGKGFNQGATYGRDLSGAARPTTGGWDIGAYQVLWTKHGMSGAGHFTIGASPGTMLGENAYCGPGDTPAFEDADGPAQLPQQCVYTATSGTPSPGTVRTAASCSDIQTQINNAAAGDTVVIPASLGRCVGNWTLPTKTGADKEHWTTIRTDKIADANFTPEGSRTSPCQIGITDLVSSYPNQPCTTPGVRMPTLSTNIGSSAGAVLNASGASFYRIIGLDLTKQEGVSTGICLVNLQAADHIILDRVLVHGSPNMTMDSKCGVSVRGTNLAIINSWIYDIDWDTPDGYGIVGGSGTQADEGPVKVYNNLVVGASESWFFGGGMSVAFPHDYEFRRNLSMKPLKWMMPIGYCGNCVNVKNLGEFKYGHRVLYEGNVFMNNWLGQSDQWGTALLLIPKNQSNVFLDKFVNVNGHTVTCASDSSGTPCPAGTGIWASNITRISRTAGVVALTVATNGMAWPNYWQPSAHIVIKNLASQVTNGVNLNTLNGEQVMVTPTYGCCTIYFNLAGADFPSTNVSAGFITDLIASTCAPNGCRFAAPKGTGRLHVADVQSSEQMTIVEDLGTLTGSTHQTCHPGLTPNAQVRDVVARYNLIQHSTSVGLDISNVGSDCSDEGMGVSNFSLHDNLADDIDGTFWDVGRNYCCGGQVGKGIGTTSNGFTDPTVWPHDVLNAHNTIAGMHGWQNGTLVSGYAAISDGLNKQYNVTYLQRTGGVTTLTTAGTNFVAGDVIDVNSFIAPYDTFNAPPTYWTLTAATATTVSFAQPGLPDVPLTAVTANTTGLGWLIAFPATYFRNYTWRDNIGPAPFRVSASNGSTVAGGVTAGMQLNACNPLPPYECTWTFAKNLFGTALYPGYSQSITGPNDPSLYPSTNQTCGAGSASCFVTDFSNVFKVWGNGMGNTAANDYHLKDTSPYKGQATDGKDLGADIDKVTQMTSGVVGGTFLYPPIAIANTSLSACTSGVYCEQQLYLASGASGFAHWVIISGTLPTGMTFQGYQYGTGTGVGAGGWRGAPYGNAGWLFGTPTQSGSFPLTIQAEDAAHQKVSVHLTLTVN